MADLPTLQAAYDQALAKEQQIKAGIASEQDVGRRHWLQNEYNRAHLTTGSAYNALHLAQSVAAPTPGPAPGPALPNPAPPSADTVPSQNDSAYQLLVQGLTEAGLGSFADIAWNDYKNGITGTSLIMSDIRKSPAYQAQFPNMDKLMQSGVFHNEGQYLTYLKTTRDLYHQYGLPAGFHDTAADISQLALGNVSTTEVEQRLQGAQQAAVAQTDPTMRAELLRNTGVTDGDLTAYWLNPQTGLAQAQQKYQAALIGSQSDRTGYGQLSTSTLADLAARGVTDAQAQAGFSNLAGQVGLFNPLPGEPTDQIGQTAQLAAQFDQNVAAQQAIQARQQLRKAELKSGGGAATAAQGAVGLRLATQSG
jgi:hypothetical protein